MKAATAHNIALAIAMAEVYEAIREYVRQGQFSRYFIDSPCPEVLEELRNQGYTCKPGISGGYHICW